jgi:metallo-beta-lactamase class B
MIALIALLLAQADPASRASNQPVAPFRITPHLAYVGASEVTSFAIDTGQGLIVLDGGFVETAPQIEQNLISLGYALRDVKILLSSHAHFDHAGGLAELKRATHAALVASEEDAPELARGGRADFAFGDRLLFPPVRADRTVRDTEKISLGAVTLTANVTAGHTRGCTTWSGPIDGKNVVFVCSVSSPGYKLVENAGYPQIASDYRESFRRLKLLPCDIFLGAHGSFFGLLDKLKRGPDAFVDPAGYQAFVQAQEADFEKKLGEQKAVPSKGKSR